MTTVALGICLSQVPTASGAASSSLPLTAALELSSGANQSARPRACSAHKAVRFFAARIAFWSDKMGVAHHASGWNPPRTGCPRYLAHVLQRKAYGLRKAYERWSYQWEWRRWLPSFWKAIIQCETRSTFSWNSGSYQGAFGFAPSSWDGYKPRGYPAEAYQATPRQQYNVALAIVRGTGGTSGWGCA